MSNQRNIERNKKGKVVGVKLHEGERLVMTQGVAALIRPDWLEGVARELYAANAMRALQKMAFMHHCGFWGDVCKEDANLNDIAVSPDSEYPGRTLSVYYFDETHPHKTSATGSNLVKLWIITEWDRSVTTILLPKEY